MASCNIELQMKLRSGHPMPQVLRRRAWGGFNAQVGPGTGIPLRAERRRNQRNHRRARIRQLKALQR